MCRLMIYNVVMSPLRGFGSWWALWFVGVNPYAVLCRPFGAWGRYIICEDSQISAEHYSVSITFSLQSYYFFLEYANFVRTNCIFCRILVVLWEIACGWWLFMPIFDGE